MERSGLWNAAAESYVNTVTSNCTSFNSTAPPQPERKVSVSTLSPEFNDKVCVDHLFLENMRVFHCMDARTRYSTAHVDNSPTLHDAEMEFETSRIAQSWMLVNFQADNPFSAGFFYTAYG